MQYNPGTQRTYEDPPYHTVTRAQRDWIQHPTKTIHELSNLLTDVLDQVERGDTRRATQQKGWLQSMPQSNLQSLLKGLGHALPSNLPLLQALAQTPAEQLKTATVQALTHNAPDFAQALYHCMQQQGLCPHPPEQLFLSTQQMPARALQSLLIRHIHWALNI